MEPDFEHRQYLNQLRDVVSPYVEQCSEDLSPPQRYKLLYDCQNHCRQLFKKKLQIREFNDVIAIAFGVTPQTLYRARASMSSYSFGASPPKYARKAYNKICWEASKNNLKDKK